MKLPRKLDDLANRCHTQASDLSGSARAYFRGMARAFEHAAIVARDQADNDRHREVVDRLGIALTKTSDAGATGAGPGSAGSTGGAGASER